VIDDPLSQYDVDNRLLPDGRMLRVHAMSYGKGRLCVYPSITSMGYDDGW
jgi:hypothetical protein